MESSLSGGPAVEAVGGHVTRCFLFADLRGYSAFTETHGDAAAAALLSSYRQLVRDAVRRFRGAEIKTEGDSFYVVFSATSEAVRCGIAIVDAAAGSTVRDSAEPIAVGIGIHSGETTETEEGYVGSAVNVAARICAQASAGEVLVSDTVRGLVRTSSGLVFQSRGRKRLKGIAEPITVYAAVSATAGAPAWASGRQRVTWRVGWAPRSAAVVAAVILAVVVAGAAALSGAIGHGTGGSSEAPPGGSSGALLGLAGAPSSPPSAIATPGSSTRSTAPSALPSGTVIEEIASHGFSLKPDTYDAVILPGTPTFTVTETGWTAVVSADGDMVVARSTTPDERFEIRWVHQLSTDACGLKPPVDVGSSPETQFVAWARSIGGLKLTPGVVRHFGDLTATEFDVTVVAAQACQYTAPVSVIVTPYESGTGIFQGGGQSDGTTNLAFTVGIRMRVEVTSRDGQLVLLLLQAPSAAEFNAFEPGAETILSTLAFP